MTLVVCNVDLVKTTNPEMGASGQAIASAAVNSPYRLENIQCSEEEGIDHRVACHSRGAGYVRTIPEV